MKSRWLRGSLLVYPSNMPGTEYHVDATNGDDDNTGLDWANSLASINAAIDKCTADQDDYVWVKECWNTDAATITVDVNRTHIIGVGGGGASGDGRFNNYCMLAATGDTPIFTVTGDYCEIAGFQLGGGATKSGIQCDSPLCLWVHNCMFGPADIGDTPAYGILCQAGTVNAYMLIENNIFLGSGGSCQGTITADGICAGGTNNLRSTTIRNNIFVALPGIAINLANAYGAVVIDNRIAMDADTTGSAITMGAGSTGCCIMGNMANYGKADGTNSGYTDGSSTNCWSGNEEGNDPTYPA